MQKVTAKVIDGTRLIGYARVSSDDQNLNMQIDALERAGCEVIYKDGGISGVKHRPALTRALKDLQPGDTFVFWKLDRLGRGALDLLNMLEDWVILYKRTQNCIARVGSGCPIKRSFSDTSR